MDAISAIERPLGIDVSQVVSSTLGSALAGAATTASGVEAPITETKTDTKSEDKPSEFESLLRTFVSPEKANEVNEEELFSGLVQERIKTLKGEEAGTKFKELLDAKVQANQGYLSWEEVTKAALKEAQTSGLLTEEETTKIYSEAFAAAQLDGNADALYDGRGSESDATIALMEFSQALTAAREKIAKFDSKEETAALRELDEASTGKASSAAHGASGGGDAGFLFKPVSDSNGNLVVLLPSSMTGSITKLVLKEGDTVLEEGADGGVGNGDRQHYRFSKPGASYPAGLIIEATLADGTTKTWTIDDTSERVEM